MTVKPETERVRAADVRPYEWAQWCSIEGGKPFANHICVIRWDSDMKHLWFMLESFNFMKVKPDDVLELIPLLPLAVEIGEAA